MSKFPKDPFFYFLSIPISFLAGFGYASSLWILNEKKLLRDFDLPDFDI